RYHRVIEQYRSEEDERFLPLGEDGDLKEAHAIQKSLYYDQALEEIMLLDEAGNDFSRERIIAGEQTPVFFGSALTNFGVETFLRTFVDFAPSPSSHESNEGVIEADNPKFSGFIFKIQANMNPAHRDRIAFIRICSGEFERGMNVTLTRTGKSMKLANSTQFMADDRETVNRAVAGDIIGLYDTGNYQIGDTITNGSKKLEFEKLPQFTPELFMRVYAKNVMKQKHFHKGVEQLVQEGAIQ
ncbi:peptide chain release factor 3, partial [Listeria monocytogenes]|nr:peptide chain release factor 3 [Listeria monocytogenes]